MASIPQGMLTDTFEYVLKFTIAHEGDTPFMYNNWPIKNANRDVTIGVGHAILCGDKEEGAAKAAATDIRSMFRAKGIGNIPSADQMKSEFRRVYDLPRTPTNLFTDYRDKSPVEMDRGEMLRDLRDRMLEYWGQKGQDFPNFGGIPAQAQVVLMSWNYGLRLSRAPKMCNAVRAGDYVEAAKECVIRTWDAQKNEAHKRLLMNAATILSNGRDLNTLPPANGPFKPPPLVAGGTTTLNTIHRQLAGKWRVAIGNWNGLFFFDANGGVAWAENDYSPRHSGRWMLNGSRLEWKFKDPGDFRTFTVPLPLNASKASGTILPAGQGWFTMSKSTSDMRIA